MQKLDLLFLDEVYNLDAVFMYCKFSNVLLKFINRSSTNIAKYTQ